MNKPLSDSELATPKVTTGPIAGSRKIYSAPDAAPDLRVPLRETDRLVATLRTRKVPVIYVVFPDEAHGFAHPENNRRFNVLVEDFLGHNLGGRVERAHVGDTLDPYLR